MAVTDLKERWSRGGPWSEELGDWVENREAALPKLHAIVGRLFDGASSPSVFKLEMDSFSRQAGHWGFKGASGQLFLNMLEKASDEEALAEALRAALPAPQDEAECRNRFAEFHAFVEDARERAPTVGAPLPAHGSVPFFLSFFWEAKERETWPIYYKNSRDTLAAYGLFQETGPLPDRYLRFRDRIFQLRDELETDTWGLETFLYRLAEDAKQAKKPEASNKETPSPGDAVPQHEDLYENYVSQDLFFPDEIITSLVLSLLTKPLVLLSGISGTGKTQLAVGLAEYLDRRSGGGVVEIDPPDTDESNVYLRLTAPRLRHHFAGLTQEHLSALAEQLPDRGDSVTFEATLPAGTTAPMRLSNIGFTDPSRQQYRLYLRGAIKDWLDANAKPGDYLHLSLEEDGAISSINLLAGTRDETETPIRRHEVVAVRSDWTDPRGLIGFENPLTGSYAKTDLISLLLRAAADPERPYLVILDEMNLARVEYYFSDFLSAMELKSGTIALRQDGDGISEGEGEAEIPGRLPLPPNVLFIGTVNIDETTHGFSPKVLDRANVLSFNEVDVQRFLEGGGEAAASTFRLEDGALEPNDFAQRDVASAAAVTRAKDVASFAQTLLETHDLLRGHNLHFGYRVLHEISAFVGHALNRVAGEDEDELARTAFDLQLVQKVLPKLGGGRELELPLVELLAFCLDGSARTSIDSAAILEEAQQRLDHGHNNQPPIAPPSSDADDLGNAGESAASPDGEDLAEGAESGTSQPGKQSGPATYPRAARELARMLQRLRQTGFVAFLE